MITPNSLSCIPHLYIPPTFAKVFLWTPLHEFSFEDNGSKVYVCRNLKSCLFRENLQETTTSRWWVNAQLRPNLHFQSWVSLQTTPVYMDTKSNMCRGVTFQTVRQGWSLVVIHRVPMAHWNFSTWLAWIMIMHLLFQLNVLCFVFLYITLY